MVGKLVPDHFIKNQNSAYLSINSVKCHIVFFLYAQVERPTKIY